MNLIALGVPVVYYLFVIALCTLLLVRGVTHLFVALFMGGSLLHFVQTSGYVLLTRMPGGFGANTQYMPILAAIGLFGTLVFVGAFISLAVFLLRPTPQTA